MGPPQRPWTTGTSTRRLHDHGAGTLEYVGATLVAALCALGLLLTPASGALGDSFQRSLCNVIQRDGCGIVAGSGRTPLERATSGRYVALGDSYSSGEGAWDYEEGTDYDDGADLWPFNDDEEARNRCHRSANAYSQVLHESNDFAGGTSFVACSGATSADLGSENGNNTGESPQLGTLDDDASMVTISVGGNDLGFADVVKDCIINGERGVGFIGSCQNKHDQRIADELPELSDRLLGYYRQIQERSPNARIIIVGYPELFVEDPDDSFRNLLFKQDMVWMNEKGADLNAMLRETAREAGVEFVDPTEAFRGHGIGSAEPWLNDLDFGGPGFSVSDPSSFHPNATGQQALADLVQQQLESPRP